VLDPRAGAPLLRLAAKSLYTDDGGPVREWSAGQYSAVSCTDYPQAFDMRAPPAGRRAPEEAPARHPPAPAPPPPPPPRPPPPGPADPAGAGAVGRARHPDHLDRRRHRGRAAGT